MQIVLPSGLFQDSHIRFRISSYCTIGSKRLESFGKRRPFKPWILGRRIGKNRFLGLGRVSQKDQWRACVCVCVYLYLTRVPFSSIIFGFHQRIVCCCFGVWLHRVFLFCFVLFRSLCADRSCRSVPIRLVPFCFTASTPTVKSTIARCTALARC